MPDPGQLLMPYTARVSPDIERARTCHHAWTEAQALWPDPTTEAAYRAADFPLFVANVYPGARGEDLDLVTDYLGWTWLWDDSFDKPGIRQADVAQTALLIDGYRNILHRRPASFRSPLLDTWRQLLRRLEDRTSLLWRQRHTALWEATFRSYLEEARNNAAGRIPTFQEYLQLRLYASGTPICWCLIEATGRFELPLHIHASDYLQTLDQDAAHVVMMTNDLFSAGMEWSAGNTDNIVPVLAQQDNCSWPEASRRAEKIINTTMTHFQRMEADFLASRLYQDLAPSAQADTDRFIEGLTDWMSGSLDWHRKSARYR